MRIAKLFLATAGAIGLSFATVPATAAQVTQCGPNICYTYDDAQSGVGSFGLPTLDIDGGSRCLEGAFEIPERAISPRLELQAPRA